MLAKLQEDKVTVVFIPNPFDLANREVIHVDFKEGKVLEDYVNCFEAYPGVDYAIGVNSCIVDNPKQPIKAGDFIGICPIPAGGKSGKNVLAIVAMIAVMVVAAQFGPALGGALSSSFGLGLEEAARLK